MDEASPHFRTDLEASATEADGIACVDVMDPQSGTRFRFYDFEYQLALQLNGQSLTAVAAWASEAYDVELTAAGIAEFATRLGELGFLRGRPAAAAEITDMGAPAGGATSAAEITDMGAPAGGATSAAEITDMGAPAGSATSAAEITDMGAPAGGAAEITAMGADSSVEAPRAAQPDMAEITDMGGGSPSLSSSAVPEEAAADGADSAESEWVAPQAAKTATFVPDSAMLTPLIDRTPVGSATPILDEAEPTPAPKDAEARDRSEAVSETPALERSAPVEITAPPERPAPAPSFEVGVPVAPIAEIPTQRLSESERSVAVTRPAEAPTVPSLPSAFARAADSAVRKMPSPVASQPPADEAAAESAIPIARSWAREIEGTLTAAPSNPDEVTPAPARGAAVATSASSGSEPAPKSSPEKSAGQVEAVAASPAAPDRVTATPPGATERRQPPKPEAVVMSGFSAEVPPGSAGAGKERTGRLAIAIVLLLLAITAAAVGYVVLNRSRSIEPHALRVRALAPTPTTIYRWFSGPGVVVEAEAQVLAFDAPGRLAELLPSGMEFGPGEILGRLRDSAVIETALAHHRSRLAFHEQMLESMRGAGNAIEARQAELKIAEKRRIIADTNDELARVTLRSSEPGEVIETLAKVGAVVKAGAPVARIRPRPLHGEFRLAGEELQAADGLGFCRVEVIGLGPHASNAEAPGSPRALADAPPLGAESAPRYVDCVASVRAAAVRGGRGLTVALPPDIGLVAGQPLRLARQRLDAVFPVPVAALDGDGDAGSVWIATRQGVAERRQVTIAGVEDGEAYVGAGLRVGDDVIVEAPAGLAPGAAIIADR